MSVILVVDDNSTIRRVLGYMLHAIGHHVVTALNGSDALEQLQAQHCDMIIADLAMPVMDGMALLKQVRVSPQFAHLPFVMLTASGQDDARIAARGAGANDFLTKPTSKRVLAETIDRWLS